MSKKMDYESYLQIDEQYKTLQAALIAAEVAIELLQYNPCLGDNIKYPLDLISRDLTHARNARKNLSVKMRSLSDYFVFGRR